MSKRQQTIVWARRVAPQKIRRLYASDAAGIVDEDLINEVGYAFYARCEAVWLVTERRCIQCKAPCEVDITGESVITCPDCGWSLDWEQYKRSYRGKRIHGGRAYPHFLTYMEDFERATTPRDKMLAIDKVIHALHESLAWHQTTPAAVNLIAAKRDEVIELLETLAYGDNSSELMQARRARWRRAMAESEQATQEHESADA
jgi:hypothetical protein